MGLSLSKLLDPGLGAAFADKYSENTNIFAYYVLAGIMVFAADEFISWCAKTNAFSLIQAPAGESKGGPAEFKKLIDQLSKNERIKKAIMEIPTDNDDDGDRTMRMTLWH
jgi:hypothetical protein